ncbi:MAG TPA: TPM domain-containing protein [Candidatus Nanoarchaeia archaeon]|nr:TPM domain-containing protein [Candidatus Nanoarchaeia archaeon]
MKIKSVLIAFLISLLILPAVLAAEYKPINYVSDYANILDENSEAQINALAEEIERNSTVEVAVLTIPSLDGGDIDQFAVETFHDWGVGKKDVNNGLLMVIAVEDREWRIEVGYGLEPIITDAMAGRIGRANFVDHFRAGNYGEGIYGAVLDVQKIIANDPEAISVYSESREEINEFKEIGWIFFSLFLFVVLTYLNIFLCRKIRTAYDKKADQKSGDDKAKTWLPSPKSILFMVILLIIFSIIMWYIYNWTLAFNFVVINLILTFPSQQQHGGGLGGFGLFGGFGGGGRGGFGGFGGGGSGGGGASGGW